MHEVEAADSAAVILGSQAAAFYLPNWPDALVRAESLTIAVRRMHKCTRVNQDKVVQSNRPSTL